ncbi:hypothetical protein HMPREF0290_2147 [Corynebacterium efficiens YS-314]|nr:hypothetical protein HMPREF0290_2147 [Corynebacterium efficiens YS-314]
MLAGTLNSLPVEFFTTVKALFFEGSIRVVGVKDSRRTVSSGQFFVASRTALVKRSGPQVSSWTPSS